MSFRATVLTLYPEMFPGPLGAALSGKALASGLWALDAVGIRDFATDKHRTVDGPPAGGGPGMVMRPDILARAIDACPGPRILLSARGRPFSQAMAEEFAAGGALTLVCGRFEGVDERVIEARGLVEIAVGDAVLSGGEVAAMVVLDAIVRLLPGVMGNAASAEEESFSDGLLEHPQYTKPNTFEGRDIPPVLLSGDHQKVAAWRQAARERLTAGRRPDLWASRERVVRDV